MSIELLLLSSSRPDRFTPYFSHAKQILHKSLGKVSSVVFIPYASPGGISNSNYTQMIQKAFNELGIEKIVKGIESFNSSKNAIMEAEAIFVGGGNTFLLLKTLYEKNLVEPLRNHILNGKLYLGSSAGSNIVGHTINTSNDMAIVHPPTLDALGIFPFNINPHYPKKESEEHSGETRAERIREFHSYPSNNQDVISLYEHSMLHFTKDKLSLQCDSEGDDPAGWLFRQNEDDPTPLDRGKDLTYLM